MDIRFWAGSTTACTVAHWNHDAAYELRSKLYLPLDGQARYAIARSEQKPHWTELRPGSLYLIPGERRHINATKSPFNLVWCHFTAHDAAIQAQLAHLDHIVAFPIELMPHCRERIANCCGTAAQRHAATALVYEALAHVPDPPSDPLLLERRRLADATFELEYRCDQHVPIHVLAAKVGLAPSRFHELFRLVHGTSVHDYRLALRIAEAKRLLETSAQSIQMIALHVGYSNPYNFTRLFTKRCGLSPSAWREKST